MQILCSDPNSSQSLGFVQKDDPSGKVAKESVSFSTNRVAVKVVVLFFFYIYVRLRVSEASETVQEEH